jgi:RNA polymerase sigma-70 factor (ECF subfamily)
MMGVMAGRLPVEAVATRTADEFRSWMVAEQGRIFALCYRFLQDRDEADTATQDTFIKAYKVFRDPGARELEEPGKWLTRVAVNTCLDRVRSRSWKFWKRRPNAADEELVLATTASREPSAEDRLFAREIEQRLAAALERLSPRQRAVFVLRHYEDKRLDEIAEILGLDNGTVKAHMARALAKLRELLKDLYGMSREKVA